MFEIHFAFINTKLPTLHLLINWLWAWGHMTRQSTQARWCWVWTSSEKVCSITPYIAYLTPCTYLVQQCWTLNRAEDCWFGNLEIILYSSFYLWPFFKAQPWLAQLMPLTGSFGLFCLCSECFHAQAPLFTSLQICSSCHQMGATLGCFFKGCPNKYHYVCAMQSGEWLSNRWLQTAVSPPLFHVQFNRSPLKDMPSNSPRCTARWDGCVVSVNSCTFWLCLLSKLVQAWGYREMRISSTGWGWPVSKCKGNVFEQKRNN